MTPLMFSPDMLSQEQPLNSHGLSQAISPFTMPPPEYNTMIPQGLAAQLARPSAWRRSGTRTSTPSTSRRGSTRISKSGAFASSPFSIQRRRTTAVHSSRDPVTGPAVPSREHNPSYRYRTSDISPQHRPYSWHPGPQHALPSHGTASATQPYIGNTIEGFENLAVSNTPPSVEQSIQDAFTMGYGPTLGLPADHRVPQPYVDMLPMQQNASVGALPLQVFGQAEPPMSNHLHAAQDHHTSWIPPSSDVDYVTPESLHSDLAAPLKAQNAILPDASDQAGEELVGIGLYDDRPEQQPYSSQPPAYLMSRKSSPTTELKLEETWQPPSGANDDDESSEEGEETEELPSLPNQSDTVQPAFYPSNLDLSNQSFFLSDNDELSSHDPYANMLAWNYSAAHLEYWKSQHMGSGFHTFF